MLTPDMLNQIKGSIELLKNEGEAITRRFYQILFERNPELKNIFNMSNQREGVENGQSRALADAIFAYASNIETPEKLMAAVNRIANKHTSLMIKPEHYPLVGEALLEALCQHLSVGMDHPAIEAWGIAYGILADIFIKTEEDIYAGNENRDGGWRGFRPFRIDRIVRESEHVRSFYLRPVDGGEILSYRPGQYIGVKFDIKGHDRSEIRQYSLSDGPKVSLEGGYYRITVKEEQGAPAGVVSTYLHRQVKVGDTLEVSPPVGDFYLNEGGERPIVLLSGGVGVTPMASMLKVALRTRDSADITFIHCAKSYREHTMHGNFAERAEQKRFKYFTVYETDDSGDYQGFLSDEMLDAMGVDFGADFYFCGPVPFMQHVAGLLRARGVARDQIHFEVFGPSLDVAA
ncbi:NO-inducible flavohemoprotein [Kordiimonas sp. SCSIO 12610]|uniref:NO-inducible flavohemoprotein n=1 Tax=Kordiimonas sp. SCSIO 12610 TaxID=2829597 RepID=UPI00210EC2F4|nr:NO-inducible flavohemoprotein [Kordiimonas sp. SCSIO 12610]UTW56078.1 NO-inducible flavohemoprotein [Kordiimonas sp. SCSIO 12610]